ncbi:MAG: hypothetical protein WA324_21715 [Bryobacteraceae bacterium]
MPEDLQLLPRPPLTAMQHGCRSQELLLEHEDPAEWRRLLSQYRNEYQPETEFLDQLMLEAAQAHWFFLRTQRNLFDTQAALPRNPMEWTDEHHRKLALFLRYQTTAERSHQRALAKLTSYLRLQQFRTRLQEQQAAAKRTADAPVTPAPAVAATASVKEKDAKKPEKPVIVEQWIEVRNVDNQMVVDFYPTNDELAVEIEQKKVKPTLLYRRLHFPNGVPAYYQWVRPRKGMATRGGMAMQRMTLETWEELREVERKTGFAESTGKATLRDWREEG